MSDIIAKAISANPINNGSTVIQPLRGIIVSIDGDTTNNLSKIENSLTGRFDDINYYMDLPNEDEEIPGDLSNKKQRGIFKDSGVELPITLLISGSMYLAFGTSLGGTSSVEVPYDTNDEGLDTLLESLTSIGSANIVITPYSPGGTQKGFEWEFQDGIAWPDTEAAGGVVVDGSPTIKMTCAEPDNFYVDHTQTGVLEIPATPSINTTTTAVAAVVSTPSNITTTAAVRDQITASNDITTPAVAGVSPQVDTCTFTGVSSNVPAHGSMTFDSQTLAWDADASTLTPTDPLVASFSGTPASGSITTTWADNDDHTPAAVDSSAMFSAASTPQIDTCTFDAPPIAGTMTFNGSSLAWDADASTLSSIFSGTPASGSIVTSWDNLLDNSPVTVDQAPSLMSVLPISQVDEVTFSATPTAGAMTFNGHSLNWDENAGPLDPNTNLDPTVIGAVTSATTPASGNITITWNDDQPHTPITVDVGTLANVVGLVDIHNIHIGETHAPTEGTFTVSINGGGDTSALTFDTAAGDLETAIESATNGFPCTVTGSAPNFTVTSDSPMVGVTLTVTEVNPLLKIIDTFEITTLVEGG